MAAVQLNVFENHPPFNLSQQSGIGVSSMYVHGIYLPGSISFDTVAALVSFSNTIGTQTLSMYFGLYSLNGSTLSLANSASGTLSNSTNGVSWFTMVTSATANIAPGNWYFAVGHSLSNGSFSYWANKGGSIADGAYGGPFVRGWYSTFAQSMPASIASSAISKEGGSGGSGNSVSFPYIVIAA